MHLQVSIALLLILLTGGFSLHCYECPVQQKGPCLNPKTCDYKCASTKAAVYIAGAKWEIISKRCARPLECRNWSLSTSSWRRNNAAQCCVTDFCNEQAAQDLISHIPNGKKCFTCDWEDCSKTISCWGNEDHCFTANSEMDVTKGCASKSACDQELRRDLGLHGEITCCEGNLCNGAQSVTQSFLFLCCSLLSYFLLH